MEKLKLYSYWRSSCGQRVRIALFLKGIECEYIAVNLLEGGQYTQDLLNVNPMGRVPTLVDGDVVISESFAILMYLDEKYPEPPLLPVDLHERAIHYQVSSINGSGMQPQQNLALMMHLEGHINTEDKIAWIDHAITKGFAALEKLLVTCCATKHVTGDVIYLADLYLASQIHGAINRFQVNMEPFPTLIKCYESYNNLPAFQDALPEKQPGAPSTT